MILIAFLLVGLNGLFVAAEFSLVKVSGLLSSLGLGWIGEPAIAALIEPLFAGIAGWNSIYTHTISITIAFSIISLLHIVLGELVPKSLAIQKAESTALATAGFLKTFYWVCYPVIRSLNGLVNLVLRIWKIEPVNEADLSHSEEELRMLVEASQRHGYLDKLEGKLLVTSLNFRIVTQVK